MLQSTAKIIKFFKVFFFFEAWKSWISGKKLQRPQKGKPQVAAGKAENKPSPYRQILKGSGTGTEMEPC